MPSTEQKPRVAIVCDTVPYPVRSGDNKRLSEMIDVLRDQGCSVHLVLTALVDRAARKACEKRVDAVHIYQPADLKTRLRNLLRRAVRLVDRLGKRIGVPPAEEIAGRLLGRRITPLILDYWQRYPKGLSRYLGELAERRGLKAVIVEFIWLYPAIDDLPTGIARILDTHDIQHKRIEDFAARGMRFPLEITRGEEARIFNRFDAVIAIQEQEASLIREMCPDLRVLTIGTTCADFWRISEAALPGRILYVGGYNGANIDGLGRFLKNCWPEIISACPHARLNVGGYIYRAFPAEEFPQVKFLGHVTDIESQYAEAEIIVNPAWIGTGLKIKTVEALAAGKPLVTTPKGVEGMPAEVEKACVVAPAEKDFSAGVVRLLTDPALRAKTAAAASVFASTHLTPESTYGELLDLLHK